MTHTHGDEPQLYEPDTCPDGTACTFHPYRHVHPIDTRELPRAPEHWTYTTGNYRGFLYWHSFEEACNAAFANSPDVMEANLCGPSGRCLHVTREQWAATTPEEWEAARKP